MLLVYIQNRCKDNRQSNFPQFDTEYRLISPFTYFTGAIELSCLETAQTISFTFLIFVAFTNASSELYTVFIYTPIPVWIFIDHLYLMLLFSTIVSIKRFFMRNRTHLTTADWIVAISAAIKTIELARTILIYLLSHQTKLEMHRPKKNGVIYHYNIDHFLASTGSNKRHRQHHSLQCTPTKLLRIFSCTLHSNPGPLDYLHICH